MESASARPWKDMRSANTNGAVTAADKPHILLRALIDIDHNPFVAGIEMATRVTGTFSGYSSAASKPPAVSTAHDPLLCFEPIIQIVPILSPALFIERIGYGCDLPLIPPRNRLSVQRGLLFLDNFFLRRWPFYGSSLLHLKSSSFLIATY